MIKKLLTFGILAFFAGTLASCESSTNPSPALTISGGNDILIDGNKAIVLANGSNSLYVVDLSSVATNDPALFVLNEGNFGKPNSSLDEVLFQMGDTLFHRNFLPDFSRVLATISFGLDGPNKMALIGTNLLLVTRRNTTSAAIVDLSKNAIVDSISLGEPSVAVAVLNNKAYITSGSYSPPGHLNILDLSSMKITKKIWLRNTPEQAVVDSAHNQVIIGTSGDYDTIPPILYFVNSSSDNIDDSLVVGQPTDDGEITTGQKHFLIVSANVYPLAGPSHTLGAPLIAAASTYYKGAYNGSDDALYLGVYDFTSGSGKVDVYNASTGTLKWSFATGIAPAHFAFYH
jgi:hypothetical protein